MRRHLDAEHLVGENQVQREPRLATPRHTSLIAFVAAIERTLPDLGPRRDHIGGQHEPPARGVVNHRSVSENA